MIVHADDRPSMTGAAATIAALLCGFTSVAAMDRTAGSGSVSRASLASPLGQDSLPRFEPANCVFDRGDWADAVDLECGELLVLEDPERPEGRVLHLPVAIFRAAEPGPKPPLVMLHGGPGGPPGLLGNMTRGVSVAGYARDRDVILYAQRGAWSARPVPCPEFQPADYEEDELAARERFLAGARACVESIRREGGDPAMYDTRRNAADLRALRQALGHEVWDVWGESYGGRLATEAMRTDPAGIRSVVLSKPVPQGPHRAERARAWRDALARVFESCAAGARCGFLFPSPEEDLQALYRELAASPARIDSVGAGGPVRLDGGALVHSVVRLARRRAGTVWIPFLLSELRRGDFERASRELMSRAGEQGSPAGATFWLVECNDQYVPGFEALQDSIEATVPEPYHVQRPLECATWREGRVVEDPAGAVSSDIPTLILAGRLDPAAPVEFARRIARTLSRAYLYELPDESHAAREATPCHLSLVAQFWNDPTTAPDGSCIEARPPLDFVTEWPNPEPGPGGHRTAAPPELEWSPCEFEPEELTFLDWSVDPTRLRCGHLSVPARRGDLESPRFRLAFVVIAAEDPDAEAPPIVYLHGGPGGSALTPYFLALEGPALAMDRDVIAFDQRGAGHSEPRLCGGLAGNDLDIAARDLTLAGEAASRRRFRLACLEELRDRGIDPGAFDMDATVADLEDLRRALGLDRWTVFGRSYGGALAQRAMREYPGTIDRAVLVTPAPLDWSNFDREVPALAATLERVVRACADDPECHAAFPDPEADLLEVFESLRERPWTVDVDPERLGSPTFAINATDFMWMVNGRLYNAAQQFGDLPAFLRALAERDSLVAAAVVQEAFGGWSDDAPVAAYGVYCRDIVDAGSRARSEEAGASYPRALRAIAGLHLEICEDWPVVPGSPEARRPVRSDIPTLLFSAGLDHVVPASTGAEILRGLPNGRLVVFAYSSHILPDSPESAECAFGIIRQFVRDPNAVDGTCAARLPQLEMSGELPDAMRRRIDHDR